MRLGLGLSLSSPRAAAAAPPAGDALDAKLAFLEDAGKLVCAWFLPSADPDQHLILNGANVEGWTAAYGTQKVDLAHETAAPQWDATLFSNKGGVTFNGTTQRLLGSGGNLANWPDASADLYMLAAVRQDFAGATTGNKVAFAYGEAAADRTVGRASASSVNRVRVTAAGNAAVGSTGDLSGAHTVGSHIDIGGTSTGYFDGAADGTASSATAALSLFRVRLGANANPSANFFWSGAIVAAAILNSTATLTDFTDLEALMRARLS